MWNMKCTEVSYMKCTKVWYMKCTKVWYMKYTKVWYIWSVEKCDIWNVEKCDVQSVVFKNKIYEVMKWTKVIEVLKKTVAQKFIPFLSCFMYLHWKQSACDCFVH